MTNGSPSSVTERSSANRAAELGAHPLRLAAIVARARNGVIGRDNALPWRLSSDLQRFKALTLGKPVLMGRRTFASLPAALPGRPNLVLTRDTTFQAKDAWVFSNLDATLAAGSAMAHARGASEVCLIGGAELFASLADRIDRFYLTEVLDDPQGDVVMPAPDPVRFTETYREAVPAGPKDEHATVYRILDRI